MRRHIIMTLVLLYVSIAAIPNTHAATYHVQQASSSDSNPCTAGSPCLTIARGLSIMTAGDTLFIHAGTYTENIRSCCQTIPNGTSWTTPVTLSGFPGETATIA